jgi:hypothetical protein
MEVYVHMSEWLDGKLRTKVVFHTDFIFHFVIQIICSFLLMITYPVHVTMFQ